MTMSLTHVEIELKVSNFPRNKIPRTCGLTAQLSQYIFKKIIKL
jgi:hypothetical protein